MNEEDDAKIILSHLSSLKKQFLYLSILDI